MSQEETIYFDDQIEIYSQEPIYFDDQIESDEDIDSQEIDYPDSIKSTNDIYRGYYGVNLIDDKN